MATTDFNLDVDDPSGREYWTRANVATGTVGLVRLNLAVHEFDSDEAENSQGMDLTPDECRALAKMLETAASMREYEDARLKAEKDKLN